MVPFDEINVNGVIPAGSTETPFYTHNDPVGTVAEGRYYVSDYLLRNAQAEPGNRRSIVKLIRDARAEDERAIKYIELALDNES